MKKNLMQIVREHKEIDEELMSIGSELEGELELRFDENNAELAEKVDGCGYILERQKENIQRFKDLSSFYSELAKSQTKKMERFQSHISANMDTIEKTKLTGDKYELKKVKNPPSCVYKEEELPAKYMQVEQVAKVSRADLLEDLKKGIEVPGATLVRKIRLESKLCKTPKGGTKTLKGGENG